MKLWQMLLLAILAAAVAIAGTELVSRPVSAPASTGEGAK
jgi:hypothetical protein